MDATDPRPKDRQAYEAVLRQWAGSGFTGPHRSGCRATPSTVEWDTGGDCYRVTFQLGRELFVIPESEFEVFVLGVTLATLFYASGRTFPDVRHVDVG